MKRQFYLIDLTIFTDYTRVTLHGTVYNDVPNMPSVKWGFQLDSSYGNWNSKLRFIRAEKQRSAGCHESDKQAYSFSILELITIFKIFTKLI
jgi:hypothetical protein